MGPWLSQASGPGSPARALCPRLLGGAGVSTAPGPQPALQAQQCLAAPQLALGSGLSTEALPRRCTDSSDPGPSPGEQEETLRQEEGEGEACGLAFPSPRWLWARP